MLFQQLPDRPSIAVLPFNNMSIDPEQEYFADGISEDIITDLSKISGLFVVARNSSFAYKGKSVVLQQVGADLGVRYVLEGSVRRSGDQVRINAQLIDVATQAHLWAERYDGSLENIFAIQDEVTELIVSALSVHLNATERALVNKIETSDIDAYDMYLQAREVQARFTPEDNADGHAQLAFVLVNAGQHAEGLDSINRAKKLNPHFSLVYLYVEAIGLFHLERYQDVIDLLEVAVARNPAYHRIHLMLAASYTKPGRLDDAEWSIQDSRGYLT